MSEAVSPQEDPDFRANKPTEPEEGDMMTERRFDEQGIPEVSSEQERAYFFYDRRKLYAVGCGDDRNATPESLAALPDGVEKDGTLLRYYGGIWGFTRVMLVAYERQYGSDALKGFVGAKSFLDIAEDVQERVEKTTNLRFTTHSAVANEGQNRAGLDVTSENSVGCAYAASIGVISAANSDPRVTTTTEVEVRELGEENAVETVAATAAANEQATSTVFGEDGASFSITRDDFLRSGMPCLILEGAHRHATDGVKAVVNFREDMVSNPTVAKEQGDALYDNDVTIAAKSIMRSFPELQLDGRLLLDAMLQDIAATRLALAQHEDESYGPEKIAPLRYGDYQTAVHSLEAVATELYE